MCFLLKIDMFNELNHSSELYYELAQTNSQAQRLRQGLPDTAMQLNQPLKSIA